MISFDDANEDMEINITKEANQKAFGFPKGKPKTAPRPQTSPRDMKELTSELGLKTDFKTKDLFEMLKN